MCYTDTIKLLLNEECAYTRFSFLVYNMPFYIHSLLCIFPPLKLPSEAPAASSEPPAEPVDEAGGEEKAEEGADEEEEEGEDGDFEYEEGEEE